MYDTHEDPNLEPTQDQEPADFSDRYQPDYTAAPEELPPYYAPTPKKKNGNLLWLALALVFSLVGGVIGAAGTAFFLRDRQQDALQETTPVQHSQLLQGQREQVALELNPIDTSRLMTAAEVYAQNVNSTVGITTSVTTNFWGYQTTSAASGSGFILSDDGYILTNHHVIEDSDSISVSLFDGTTYDARLIGYDKSNDIAVLKVDASGLPPVILGNSDTLNVGDSVVAIGNPLGELTFSLTAGTVSAKDRQITMSTGATMNLLQTDCAINSGNSGGALFNLYGEVIGITNAKYSSSGGEASIDNIGFAIPLNDVLGIVRSIIEKGYIAKPYIGVSVTDVSAETQSYGLPQGAAVRAVMEDSPAEAAGLAVNDIITHVNGTAITGRSALVSMVGDAAIGDTFTLTVYRRGETLELTLTVGEQIQSAIEETQEQSDLNSNAFPWSPFPR